MSIHSKRKIPKFGTSQLPKKHRYLRYQKSVPWYQKLVGQGTKLTHFGTLKYQYLVSRCRCFFGTWEVPNFLSFVLSALFTQNTYCMLQDLGDAVGM